MSMSSVVMQISESEESNITADSQINKLNKLLKFSLLSQTLGITSTTTDNNERGNGVPLTQMNGRSSWPQPQWPSTQLLTISYQLQNDYTVTVTGTMMNPPKSLTVSLETGSNILDENIVCQLAAKFYENKLYINNGKVRSEEQLEDIITAGDLLDGSNFIVGFACRGDEYMDIYSQSPIQQVALNDIVQNIRYLSVDGNVQSINNLSYSFGPGLRGDQIYALPEWPRPRWPNDNAVVFLVPRTLQSENSISVSGSMMYNPNNLTISLVTHQSRIACQLDAKFDENSLLINADINGQLQDVRNDTSTEANIILSGSDFNLSFTCRGGNGENFYDIYYKNGNDEANSGLDLVSTGHDFSDVRYIVLEGNISLVKTLEFRL